MKLFTKSNAPDAKLGIMERTAYMSGNIGIALLNTIVASFVMFYYTDVMMLNAGVIGGILLASRLLDGVTDLIMGVIVDHTHSKLGRGRAWMLRMCIPFAVCGVLMMSVPNAGSDVFKYIYVAITYNLFNSICLTAVYVPYNSLTVTLTSDTYERGVLGIFAMFGAIIGTLAVQSTVDVATKALGGGPAAWRTVTMIYAAIGLALHLFCFFTTKERNVSEKQMAEKLPIKKEIKSVITNKYWLIVIGAVFFTLFFTGMVGGSGMYYAKGILGDTKHYSTVANALSIAQLVGMFLAFIPMKKLGKRNTMMLGLGFVVVVSIVQFFLSGNLIGVLVCNALRGIGAALSSAVLYGMVADSIDYGEWKSGISAAGIGSSAMTFVTKIAGGLSSALIGILINNSAYDATKAVQPESAITAINLCYTLIPVVCGVIAFVLLLFYKLDKIFPQIQKDLTERRGGMSHEN